MTEGYFVADKEASAAMQMHDLRDPEQAHDDLQASTCRCRSAKNGIEPFTGNHAVFVAPNGVVIDPIADQPKKFSNVGSGPSCANCGNITVLQGSCWLCQTCGTTTGCG